MHHLTPDERCRLESRFTSIYLASFVGPTPAQVAERFIYRGPDLRIVAFYDEADEIVGFVSSAITREHIGDNECGVVDGGVYVLPGVKGGGGIGVREVFVHSLQHMLRHPRIPLCSLGLALTPASYSRLVQTLPSYLPQRGVTTTAEIEALVRESLAQRGLVPVGSDPWVVRRKNMEVRLRTPERLATSHRITSDQDAAYYRERNPDYANGDAMVVYFSLTPRNLIPSIAQVFSASLHTQQKPKRSKLPQWFQRKKASVL